MHPLIRLSLCLAFAGALFDSPVAPIRPALAAQQAEGRDVDLGIRELPATVEAFLALRDQLATSPEGAVAIFLVALNIYAENRTLGRTLLTLAVDARHLKDSRAPEAHQGKLIAEARTWEINRVLEGSPATARAYWKGASPANGYAPAKPYAVALYLQPGARGRLDQYARATTGREVEEWQFFVRSEGYRNAGGGGRPISVARNEAGLWQVTRFNGVVAAVMKPADGSP
ncbi:MAG: hypothetical protein VKP62_09885 [Candidatus Sericytochromatia bacterium]|nr:hypothetical protein [Candidatus Sericytochromatia bacterium]